MQDRCAAHRGGAEAQQPNPGWASGIGQKLGVDGQRRIKQTGDAVLAAPVQRAELISI
jgi:hypothetical protein